MCPILIDAFYQKKKNLIDATHFTSYKSYVTFKLNNFLTWKAATLFERK